MEAIKNWVYSICIASIAVAMLSMFSPGGRMEKTMRFTISLFFVSMMLALPLNGLDGVRFYSHSDAAARVRQFSEADAAEARTALYRKKLEDALRKNLAEIGVYPEDLSAEINIDDNNRIDITKVHIRLKTEDANRGEEVLKRIQKEVNCTPILE